MIAFSIGAAIGTVYFLSAIAANADSFSQITIAQNGQTMIRGATVTNVQGTVLTVTTSWGDTRMQWKVVTTGSTRFFPRGESRSILKEIEPGHTVSITGSLDPNASAPTVYASAVKDESLVQSDVTLSGNVLSAEGDALLITTQYGTSTVRVGTGTLMTMNGNRADSDDVKPGDLIKAFGTFNALNRELVAQRVTASSPDGAHVAGGTGILASIFSFFSRGQGALSVR